MVKLYWNLKDMKYYIDICHGVNPKKGLRKILIHKNRINKL